jgi:hypothetical protein
MTTGEGTIQCMACVTTADEKYQIIVHAQAFGIGQEQATAQWLMYCMIHNIEKFWMNSEVESWA